MLPFGLGLSNGRKGWAEIVKSWCAYCGSIGALIRTVNARYCPAGTCGSTTLPRE